MLLTRTPLYSGLQAIPFSFDLHVLSTPPAFILSQNQTLQLNSLNIFYVLSKAPKRHASSFVVTNQFSKIKTKKISVREKLPSHKDSWVLHGFPVSVKGYFRNSAFFCSNFASEFQTSPPRPLATGDHRAIDLILAFSKKQYSEPSSQHQAFLA